MYVFLFRPRARPLPPAASVAALARRRPRDDRVGDGKLGHARELVRRPRVRPLVVAVRGAAPPDDAAPAAGPPVARGLLLRRRRRRAGQRAGVALDVVGVGVVEADDAPRQHVDVVEAAVHELVRRGRRHALVVVVQDDEPALPVAEPVQVGLRAVLHQQPLRHAARLQHVAPREGRGVPHVEHEVGPLVLFVIVRGVGRDDRPAAAVQPQAQRVEPLVVDLLVLLEELREVVARDAPERLVAPPQDLTVRQVAHGPRRRARVQLRADVLEAPALRHAHLEALLDGVAADGRGRGAHHLRHRPGLALLGTMREGTYDYRIRANEAAQFKPRPRPVPGRP
ncbi:unnamed protein product, partial [Pelagomonas calceolata]